MIPTADWSFGGGSSSDESGNCGCAEAFDGVSGRDGGRDGGATVEAGKLPGNKNGQGYAGVML